MYSLKEIKGKEDNPKIVQMFNDLGFAGAKLKDETAWCSLFVNWCCKVAGLGFTGKLNAKSWLELGEEIPFEKAQLGDVVIFQRGQPDSWMGHVGFYINLNPQDENWINVLGGNQRNEVNITGYHKNRWLGFRRLK